MDLPPRACLTVGGHCGAARLGLCSVLLYTAFLPTTDDTLDVVTIYARRLCSCAYTALAPNHGYYTR